MSRTLSAAELRDVTNNALAANDAYLVPFVHFVPLDVHALAAVRYAIVAIIRRGEAERLCTIQNLRNRRIHIYI